MIRKQTLIMLFIFLALLALVFYLQENPLPSAASTTPSPTARAQVLPELNSGQMSAITLVESDGEKIALTRDASGGWRLGAEGLAADAGKIQQISAQLNAMQVMTFLPEGTTPDSTLGLAEPVYVLTVRSGENQQSQIRVGKSIPTGNGYYAQVNDQTPIVIDQNNIDAIVGLMSDIQLVEPAEEPLTPAP